MAMSYNDYLTADWKGMGLSADQAIQRVAGDSSLTAQQKAQILKQRGASTGGVDRAMGWGSGTAQQKAQSIFGGTPAPQPNPQPQGQTPFGNGLTPGQGRDWNPNTYQATTPQTTAQRTAQINQIWGDPSLTAEQKYAQIRNLGVGAGEVANARGMSWGDLSGQLGSRLGVDLNSPQAVIQAMRSGQIDATLGAQLLQGSMADKSGYESRELAKQINDYYGGEVLGWNQSALADDLGGTIQGQRGTGILDQMLRGDMVFNEGMDNLRSNWRFQKQSTDGTMMEYVPGQGMVARTDAYMPWFGQGGVGGPGGGMPGGGGTGYDPGYVGNGGTGGGGGGIGVGGNPGVGGQGQYDTVDQLMSGYSDSPLAALARSQSLDQMAARGMQNSAMASSAGELAALQAYLPVAQQDSGQSFEDYAQRLGYTQQLGLNEQSFGHSMQLMESEYDRRSQMLQQEYGNTYALEQLRQTGNMDIARLQQNANQWQLSQNQYGAYVQNQMMVQEMMQREINQAQTTQGLSAEQKQAAIDEIINRYSGWASRVNEMYSGASGWSWDWIPEMGSA